MRSLAALSLLLAVGAIPAPPEPKGLPSFLVQDVKRRRDPAPKGPVRIWCLRSGVWSRTKVVDAAIVEWHRLNDNDRIEVVDAG